MGTDHKEKLIRVLQILEETDEKSPMNATQILKYLEEEYQIQLFVRTARGMVPTREGQQFIAQARRVIQEIEGLNRKFPGNKNRTAPCHWLH